MLKVGQILICKKYHKGVKFEINKNSQCTILLTDDNGVPGIIVENEKYDQFVFYRKYTQCKTYDELCIWDFFYTNQDVRKEKLKKLNQRTR